MARSAFTLIELLVVVTMVALLLALLTPALDKAIHATEMTKCLVNQRVIAQGCQQYAFDHRGLLPPWEINGKTSSAYDLRGTWSDPNVLSKFPLGLGLLPAARLLPSAQLGK